MPVNRLKPVIPVGEAPARPAIQLYVKAEDGYDRCPRDDARMRIRTQEIGAAASGL